MDKLQYSLDEDRVISLKKMHAKVLSTKFRTFLFGPIKIYLEVNFVYFSYLEAEIRKFHFLSCFFGFSRGAIFRHKFHHITKTVPYINFVLIQIVRGYFSGSDWWILCSWVYNSLLWKKLYISPYPQNRFFLEIMRDIRAAVHDDRLTTFTFS